jgi:hypothetical protein
VKIEIINHNFRWSPQDAREQGRLEDGGTVSDLCWPGPGGIRQAKQIMDEVPGAGQMETD